MIVSGVRLGGKPLIMDHMNIDARNKYSFYYHCHSVIVTTMVVTVSRTSVSCNVRYGNIIGQSWVHIHSCIPTFGVFVLKITKGHILVFGLYLKSICKYNQIHLKITILPTKGKDCLT